MSLANQLVPFVSELFTVRTISRSNNEIWFIASDVCASVGVANVSQALTRLDGDEKDVILNDTLGGTQKMSIVNESGLYSLILSSRKPQAKLFKKWVTSEVLPSIRKTGSYHVQKESPQDTKGQISAAVKIASNATGRHPLVIHKALRENFNYPNIDAVQANQLSAIMAFLSDYVKNISTNALPEPKQRIKFVELDIPETDAIPDLLNTREYYSIGTMRAPDSYSKGSPIQRLREAVKTGKPIAAHDLSGVVAEIDMLESLAMRAWDRKTEVVVNPLHYVNC